MRILYEYYCRALEGIWHNILCRCLMIIGCCASPPLFAQHSPALQFQMTEETFGVERFSSSEHGFSTSEVLCIMQDKKGVLWIGTQSGLHTYNGIFFTIYQHNPQEPTSLSNNVIHSLFEDKDGTIWVGTANGLNRFHPATNSFIHYFSDPQDLRSLSSNIIKCFAEDEQGNLWIGTNKGLNVFDSQAGIFHHLFLPKNNNDNIYSQQIASLFTDSKRQLWCLPQNGYLLAHINAHKKQFTGKIIPLLQQTSVVAQSRLHSDSVWVGFYSGGVALVRLSHQKIERTYLESAVNPITKRSIEVADICPSTNGLLWVATLSGLYVVEPESAQALHFTHDPANTRSICSNHIREIFEDKSGVLWFGDPSSSGLSKYAPFRNKFRLYSFLPFNPNSLSNSYIRGICEDKRGNLWVGTQYGGLNHINRLTGKIRHFAPQPGKRGAIQSANIWALKTDSQGVLWVGAQFPGGLYYTNPESAHPIFHKFNHINLGSAECQIQVLYEDRAGNLWVGTNSDSTEVYKISPDRKTVSMITRSNSGVKSLLNIQDIFEDRHGNIWFAGVFGLYRLQPSSNTFTHFTHNRHNPRSLSDNFVTGISERSNGELWLTTKGGGICKFNPQTLDFVTITERDGLPNNNTYAILEDPNHVLWISSDNGICSYHPERGVFSQYTVHDGLQGKEFNRRAYFLSKTGEMFFGGTSGFNSFFPITLKKNTIPPDVLIYSVTVARDTQFINPANKLTLRHSQNNLTIAFAALEYTAPERNLYRWKLDGLETTWSPITTKHEAIYTNLSPKTYTFRVKAANADGTWSATEQVFTIVIEPAWWQTWAFSIGCGLFAVVIIAGIVKWRVRSIEFRNKELERVVAERTSEIQRHLEQLDEQTRVLERTNNDLKAANEHVEQQMREQAEQALKIEAAYSQLDATNEVLTMKNEQLTELNQEKNEFLGIVSHDLKNPLNSILGLSALLQGECNNMNINQIEDFVNIIYRSATRMDELIKNLLDINAIERGALNITLEKFEATLLIQSIVQDYRTLALSKDIQVYYSEDLPSMEIVADKLALTQIIDNLLSNAVKYSPLGKNIYVRVRYWEPNIRIEVRDEGPGITLEDQKRLFGKFARLSAKPTGGENSTGLGLSIVKKMITAMEGNVWCESSPETMIPGATFIVELPTTFPQHSQSPYQPHKRQDVVSEQDFLEFVPPQGVVFPLPNSSEPNATTHSD